ncbi:MAG TPA: PAS domain S-box protein [Flavisolibacter sp.]|nr:PAS domain S-box protein [Flavisolibacter sp.]
MIKLSEPEQLLFSHPFEENRMLRNMLNASGEAICVVDGQGRFVFANSAAARLWNCLPEELPGTVFTSLVLEEDEAHSLHMLALARYSRSPASFENRCRKKDGSIVHMQWSCHWSSEEQLLYITGKDLSADPSLKASGTVDKTASPPDHGDRSCWWEVDLVAHTSHASDELYRVCGLDPSSNPAINLDLLFSIVHPQDLDQLRLEMEKLEKADHFRYEHRAIKPSGELVYLRHDGEIRKNEKGQPVYIRGRISDISQLKTEHPYGVPEQKLAEHLEHLAGILDCFGDGFFTVDENDIVTFWNKKAEELLNRKKEYILGRKLWDEFKEVMHLRFYEAYREAVEKKQPVHFEEYYPPTSCWLEVSAYPSEKGLSIYFRNVSERREKDEALRICNERFEFVAKATRDVVWDWNLENGAVYLSDSFQAVFGHAIEGQLLFDKIHPDDRQEALESNRCALHAPGQQFWSASYRFMRADGSITFVNNRAYITRNSEGRALRMTGALLDVTREKEGELLLEKREKRFRAMVQSGKEMIIVANAGFRVEYSSPNHQALMGFTPEPDSLVFAPELIHPEDRDMLVAAAARISAYKTIALPHYRCIDAQGEYRWLETTLSNHLDDEDIQAIIANTIDVTSEKQAADEVKKLSLIAKKTASGVMLTDEQQRITWVNAAFTQITGFSFEEAIGKHPGQLLQGDGTNANTIAYLRSCIEQKEAFRCEILNYKKNGDPCWIELSGQPLADDIGKPGQFFATMTDVTQRKEAEKKVRMSGERYKLLFDQSPSPKWIFHAASYRLVEVNCAACELYGYSREEFLTLTIPDLKLPEDIGHFESLMNNRAEGLRSNRIVKHKKKNGEVFSIEIFTHGIMLEDGLHIMVVGNDMTEKLEMQRQIINDMNEKHELQKKLNQVMTEEKLSAQQEVSKAIIQTQEKERSEIGKKLHDNVNQILTTAKLYVENIGYYPDQQAQFIEKSRDLLQRSINEIRMLSRALVTPTIRDIGFRETLLELVDSYKELNVFEVRYLHDFDESGIDKGIRLTIYRILQEQFSNAVKYAKATLISVSIKQQKQSLLLTYEDNGVGFDPAGKKAGLGLNNIKNRAEVFKGSVRLEAAPGKGCKMKISFPL